jgi:hypothetical protein
MDVGDHVIVVNADKVELTRGKEDKKMAYRHSGYPGGIRGTSYSRLLQERPQRAVEKAVWGMLPKNRLGRKMIGKLHVVAGPDHPHVAQKPTPLRVGERPVWSGLPDAVPAPARIRATAPSGPRSEVAEDAAEPETAGATTAEKATARKPATAKATAKKPVAKKTTAKKTAAKKTVARKTTAKKTTAKKPVAKKTTAKKSTAKTPPKRSKE